MSNVKIDEKAANNLRILAAAMVEKAQSGHPGGAMGGADFAHILFNEYLNFNPEDPTWPFRDRFFLDPGHMSPLLYAALTLCGYYTIDDIKDFRQWGSKTPGHPEKDLLHGVENTSGPLGLGHAFGIGAAIAERFLASRFGEWMSNKTYVYISDGGIQEEISQGAGRVAGFLGLSNLIMFYDANKTQLSTKIDEVTSEDTAKKYEAWGWYVQTIDGNKPDEIRRALDNALKQKNKPTLIIGKTIMGKGIVDESGNSFENRVSTHGMPISKAGGSFEKTIANLGGDTQNAFSIFPDVEKHYHEAIANKKKLYTKKKETQLEWEKKNPDKALKMKSFLEKKIPEIPFEQIAIKPDSSTRDASGSVLAFMAERVENMIVSSADLSESDKTISFLKKSKSFTKKNFSGAFLQAGVSELTMAALSCGMALHGGVIPVCATFFVFSDYMKPAIRIAALMELPVIFLWTHDSFRVGEDGPTHQPVEHETQIRLLEQLKNHKGMPSTLVLRPADGWETISAWKQALENKIKPTALILSRQNIKDLPAGNYASSFERALNTNKGAYIAWESIPGKKPELILIANGSEVSTLLDAARIYHNKTKTSLRIVSIISIGLFLEQSGDYIEQTIPENIPVFGLTAGLPGIFSQLNRKLLYTHGLDHFGDSAPAPVLDEKYGFLPQQVAEIIEKCINNK